jgi:hypothetical protein
VVVAVVVTLKDQTMVVMAVMVGLVPLLMAEAAGREAIGEMIPIRANLVETVHCTPPQARK